MSVSFDIGIENAPLNLKYTPENNVIPCTFDITFNKPEYISHITCGILGHATVTVYNRGVHNETYWKSYNFLDLNQYVDIGNDFQGEVKKGYQMYNIPAKTRFTKKCVLEFPQDRYLLSSCWNLNDAMGKIEVQYSLYVNVYRIGGLFTKRPKVLAKYYKTIDYQSGKDKNRRPPNNIMSYELTETYKNKVKTFYFDENTNALIPTAMKDSHNLTQFIRKAWDKKYDDENYKTSTKTIPLKIKLDINSNFELRTPIIHQFNAELISELGKCGVSNNQTTDFVFNDQSTHLGVFKIESFSIKLKYNLFASAGFYNFNYNNSIVLINTTFNNFVIDLKDLDYNKETGECVMPILPEKLMQLSSIDLNQSIIDIVNDGIICSGSIGDWFSNTIQIKVKWIVSDGFSMRKEFNFITAASPDY